MFGVVVVAVACLLATSQSAVVKKENDADAVQAELTRLEEQSRNPSPEMQDTSEMMGEVGEVAALSGSIMNWLKDQEAALRMNMAANQNGGGGAVSVLTAVQSNMDEFSSDLNDYMAKMAKMARVLGETRMREAGIHKRSTSQSGPEAPNLLEGMPDLSQIMQNMNADPHSANADAAKMIEEYNKMMQQRIEQMTRDMMKNMNAYGLTPGTVNRKRSGKKTTALKRNASNGEAAGSAVGAPNFSEGTPDFSTMMASMNAAGMPDLSQVMQNTNIGSQSANAEAAKMIEEYNKMMQQRIEQMTRDMMKNMNAYGLTPETVNRKRSEENTTTIDMSALRRPNFSGDMFDLSALMGAGNPGGMSEDTSDFSHFLGRNGNFDQMMEGLNEMLENIARLSQEMTEEMGQYGLRQEDLKH